MTGLPAKMSLTKEIIWNQQEYNSTSTGRVHTGTDTTGDWSEISSLKSTRNLANMTWMKPGPSSLENTADGQPRKGLYLISLISQFVGKNNKS